ncbi:helix-turn-helix domain-containing protein [Hamadaea tsunoensis]|uniref:helix-turn-helix domain-containing protein n=1 Tax=Hamadaea tsunoensis TaxID=53368 RepID=UPI0004140DBE|nr:helix-turn-helix transcriptional regulator [Hamadaea tsunoensis]
MNSVSERQAQADQLAEALRTLRRRTGMSGKDFASRLGWHSSRVSRLERGRQTPTKADLRAWATTCSASRSEFDELTVLLRKVQAVHRDWRRRLQRGQTAIQADYNQLVAGAQVVRHFETAWIPGLLQTAEYARRVFREQAELHDLDVHDEDAAVTVRLARQRHLYNPAKQFEFLLAEPVLRWRTCPGDVLRGQLGGLTEAAGLPNVRIGILPLDRALRTTPQNAFQIYDRVTVVETFAGETYYDDATSAAYLRIMERLWADAMTGDDFVRVIQDAAAALH